MYAKSFRKIPWKFYFWIFWFPTTRSSLPNVSFCLNRNTLEISHARDWEWVSRLLRFVALVFTSASLSLLRKKASSRVTRAHVRRFSLKRNGKKGVLWQASHENCALKYAAQFLWPSLNMPKIQALKGVVLRTAVGRMGSFTVRFLKLTVVVDYARTFIHLLRIFLLFTCTCSAHKILLKFFWQLVLVRGKR